MRGRAAFAMNVMLFTLPVYFGMERTFPYAGLFGILSLVFGTLSLLTGGSYFLGPDSLSGDWFTSRTVDGHLLMQVQTTRARVEISERTELSRATVSANSANSTGLRTKLLARFS